MRVFRLTNYRFKPYYNVKQLRPLPELLDLHQVYYCMKYGILQDTHGNTYRFSDITSRMEEVPNEYLEKLEDLSGIFEITKGGH